MLKDGGLPGKDKNLNGYAEPLVLAISVCLLLYSIHMIIKIKFDRHRELNWFSLPPYWLILSYLVLEIIEAVLLLTYTRVNSDDESKRHVPPEWLTDIFGVVAVLNLIFYTAFITL